MNANLAISGPRGVQFDPPSTPEWGGFLPQTIEHADDVWMSADEIGAALEYENPSRAIRLLYNRNRELLEPYTGVVKLTTPGGQQDARVFNEEGVILLCMKSNQPKAIAFQRWAAAELKARRRARYMDALTYHAKLEDRVNYLTAKLMEIHERHERVNARRAKRVSLSDAVRILDLFEEGYNGNEIAGMTGWSNVMCYSIRLGNHQLCRDIERLYPNKAQWMRMTREELAGENEKRRARAVLRRAGDA